MTVTCICKFENKDASFYSGKTMSGTVSLTFTKPISIKGISLEITGTSTCDFPLGYNSERASGKEDHLKLNNFVYGAKDGVENVINPGTYSYDFQCLLELTLPPTFKSSFGNIKYILVTTVHRLRKTDDIFKNEFTIKRDLDLNLEPSDIKSVVQDEKIKRFCCWCCSSQNLKICSEVSRTGFVPGDTIDVKVSITNGSDVLVDRVNTTFRKVVTLTSQYGKEMENIIVILKETNENNIQEKDFDFVTSLHIPLDTIPTIQHVSNVISVTYDIAIECVCFGPHIDPLVRIPILIGTIPFNDNNYY